MAGGAEGEGAPHWKAAWEGVAEGRKVTEGVFPKGHQNGVVGRGLVGAAPL